MKEMIAIKRQQIDSNASQSSVDILTQLVEHNEEGSSALTDSEVLGNLFFFIIAGHETTASSLHMSILLLALHPKIQSQVQQELAQVFNGRPPSEWSYEHDLPHLFNGILHAVLLEELRLVSPILTIPKVVSSRPQSVMVEGSETTLPANTTIRLCMSAVHVNPRFWPHGAPTNPQNPIFTLDNLDNDLEEFKPQRWLKAGVKQMPSFVDEHVKDKFHDLDMPHSIATSPRLYTPAKGSYIPFGEGQRSCLGRRFAQVEILTALAVMLSQHSVELAVGEWASDKEVSEMTKEQRTDTWNKAADAGRRAWKDKLTSGLTVKLRGDAHVPFRFVEKGEERFYDL
jgi:cytochrome P450